MAIGGGTGLSGLLRGLKHHTDNLTAIVTVADDGGSSGRLRTDLKMPPPGDARQCLVALAESEDLVQELFQYRFNGESPLGSHSVGNLILAALYDMEGGFPQALKAAAQLLGLRGAVVPASAEADLELVGETLTGQIVRGESAVGNAEGGVRRVWIHPEGARASAGALEAIQQAEVIVIGPGSLYTSIIPNFMLLGFADAISASPAPKVFICNVATQAHETDGYGVVDHLQAFQAHAGVALTHLLVNSETQELPPDCGQVAIAPVSEIKGFAGHLLLADLFDPLLPTRHHSGKLAMAIMAIG